MIVVISFIWQLTAMSITITDHSENRNTITISPFVVNCTAVPHSLNGNGIYNWYGTDKIYLEEAEKFEGKSTFFLATPWSAKINPVIRATGLLISLISFFTIFKTRGLAESKTIKKRFRFLVYFPISIAFVTYLAVNAYFQARGLTIQDFQGLENCYIDYSLINSKTGYIQE